MSVAMTNSVRESISIAEKLAGPIDVNQPRARTCPADRFGGKAGGPLEAMLAHDVHASGFVYM
jgi:hypothetical protein